MKFLNPRVEKRKRRIWIYIALGVVLIFLIYMQPFLTSYFVFGKDENNQSDLEMEKLKQELIDIGNKYNNCINEKSSFNEKISGCESERNLFEMRLSDYEDKYNECDSEIKGVKKKLEEKEEDLEECKDDCNTDRLKEDLSECKTNLNNCNEDLDECDDKTGDYDTLAKNAAKIICCMRKIYDNDIDSYKVEGNNIKCIVGGENKISCF